MSSVASSEQSKRPLSPFAVPECGSCMGQRLHTPEDWKAHHPLAGHGFTEQGWTHPEAKLLHEKELEALNAKRAASNRTPEAN